MDVKQKSMLPEVTSKVGASRRLLDGMESIQNNNNVSIIPQDDQHYQYGLI